MSLFNQKIARHTRNQEYITKNKEGNQIGTDTDGRISRQDIKTVVTVFHVFKRLDRDIEIQKHPNSTSIDSYSNV